MNETYKKSSRTETVALKFKSKPEAIKEKTEYPSKQHQDSEHPKSRQVSENLQGPISRLTNVSNPRTKG